VLGQVSPVRSTQQCHDQSAEEKSNMQARQLGFCKPPDVIVELKCLATSASALDAALQGNQDTLLHPSVWYPMWIPKCTLLLLDMANLGENYL